MYDVCGWMVPDRDDYFAPFLRKENGFQLDHLERAILRCRETRWAVDGGASIGTWTISMASRFDCVWAFEPARDTFECLEANLAGDKCLNSDSAVIAFNEALSDQDGYTIVVHDSSRDGNSGSDYIAAPYLKPKQTGDVKTRRLDDYGLTDLDLLKLDLEGHEYFALKGAKKTVQDCRPVVIMESMDKGFEMDRYGIEFGKATLLLESWGYEMVEFIRPDGIFVPK